VEVARTYTRVIRKSEVDRDRLTACKQLAEMAGYNNAVNIDVSVTHSISDMLAALGDEVDNKAIDITADVSDC
jgi:hypothetical protein